MILGRPEHEEDGIRQAYVMEARLITQLPKAHLHLHFTGSMRHTTLVELAEKYRGIRPGALVENWPPKLRATDERGWFRFQRLYDIARSVLGDPDDVRRLLLEAAQDEAAEGSGWLEIQVDPSGYAPRFGGLNTFRRVGPGRREARHQGDRCRHRHHRGGQPHQAPA